MTPSVLDQLRRHRSGEPVERAERDAEALPSIGAYARISDAYEGPETGITTHGVQRQLRACKHIAEARSWAIVKQYVDNSVSAFKTNVVRDAFEELLEDLDAGLIDGIVCYNLDRFARQVSDLERAIAIYDQARKDGRELFFATAEGDLNLASDDGLTMARVMVAFANKSSRDTARRVTFKHQEMRDEGRAVGGGRPFGWDWQYDERGKRYHVLNAREADAIRWATEGLTDGSLTWLDIVREWNERGLKTPRGGLWQPQTVKHVMKSPRLAGWLVHKGRIAIHSRTGQLIRAKAPAILNDEEYEVLLVAIDGRRGYTTASGRSRYLLAGIVRCAECGGKMHGNKAGQYAYYVCHPNKGNDARDGRLGCGKTAISVRGLDSMVTELVLPRIIEETKGVSMEAEKPHQEKLLELETEKDRLLAAYRERRATSETVFPEVTRIESEIEHLRHEQSEWLRERRVAARSVAITADTWNDLDVAERRSHVSRHIEAIYISRAKQRGLNRMDPSRVSMPVWRTKDGGGALPSAASP